MRADGTDVGGPESDIWNLNQGQAFIHFASGAVLIVSGPQNSPAWLPLVTGEEADTQRG